MSYICEVLKYWPLKDSFCSISQKFYRAAILWKLYQISNFQQTFLLRAAFRILHCRVYSYSRVLLIKVDLDDIQWNEVATSTARNFNNSWPLYLNFSNMINLCLSIWFIENSKCQQFLFWKRSRQKSTIFHIFTGPSFRNGWLYWHEYWRVLRNFCGLSKKCSFATFPEI